MAALTKPFILLGVPVDIRSDNGAEFLAQAVRDWITAVGAKTAYICCMFHPLKSDGVINE